MTHEQDCIFCKIINGDIPAYKVYEDEHVLAFLDISQVTNGHTLVIPKDHHKDLYELPTEVAKQLFAAVPTIAQGVKKAFNPIGLNLLNNNGEDAGQSVFHYHIHIIPRYGKGDGFGAVWKSHQKEYNETKYQETANKIKSSIS